MAVCLIMMVGMLGLVFDLGRSFIAKNEAQAFTDAAALAAAVQLNGYDSGLANARNAVTTMENAHKWQFNTKPFSTVTVEFSTDGASWTTAPPSPTGLKYARVTTLSNGVTMYFLTAVGAAQSVNVAARSVAGGGMPTTLGEGVSPFGPLAHSSVAPDFGYLPGDELTLLWPSSIGSNGQSVKMNNLCTADQNQAALDAVKAGSASDRGYIQDSSASSIAAAIVDDHMDYTVTLGGRVERTAGVKSNDVTAKLAERVAQDSDPHTTSYAAYIANHGGSPLRRVLIVPILDGAVNPSTVLGFAKVFLPPNQPHNPNDSKCATYIGPADGTGSNTGSGGNIVRLLE